MDENEIIRELQRIDLRLELDVSWGQLSLAKNDAIAHAVRVRPLKSKRYNLLILVPNWDYPDDGIGISKLVLTLFLEDGDKYSMIPIDKTKVADFCTPGTAIISFDPNYTTNFFWLSPPDHEKN